MHNFATILRSVRITVHQDEILQSGRGVRRITLTEEESWLMTSRSKRAIAPRQTKFKESK
jgi:hypothetical protein